MIPNVLSIHLSPYRAYTKVPSVRNGAYLTEKISTLSLLKLICAFEGKFFSAANVTTLSSIQKRTCYCSYRYAINRFCFVCLFWYRLHQEHNS